MDKIIWQTDVRANFDKIMAKIPVFLRPIAEKKVGQKAIANAQSHNRIEVQEQDMVDAFFSETPFGFHGPLKMDMEEIGIDYQKYGHPK